MKKFLLVSDLDGTICRNFTDEGKINDIENIAFFRKEGGIFGVNSGRALSSLLSAVTEKGIEYDFLLANTSAVCYMNGDILFSIEIDISILFKIYEYLQSLNNLVFGVTRLNEDFFIKTGIETRSMSGIELNKENFKSIGFFNQCNAMFSTEIQASEATCALNENFGSVISAFQNGICIDIVKKGHNKAVGIKVLAEKLEVDYENIFTIGDNFNDIPMLDSFRSFVVASGKEEVKKHAKEAVVKDIGEATRIILQHMG